METGVTDSGATGSLAGFLLLQWDGLRLQWLVGTDRVVHNCGEQPAKDLREFEFTLRDLHGKGLTADRVIWSLRSPSISVWPAILVEGVEEQAFRLEHKSLEGMQVRVFRSEGMAEEHVFVEAAEKSVGELVESVWPQAERVSAIQQWAEAAIRQDLAMKASSICLDVGHKRTLLVRTVVGVPQQIQILPSSDPEGLLYHVVNGLHRNGLEPANCGAVVRWSGETAMGDTRWTLFSRFFPEMEINAGFRGMQWGELNLRRERWVSLTNLTACV